MGLDRDGNFGHLPVVGKVWTVRSVRSVWSVRSVRSVWLVRSVRSVWSSGGARRGSLTHLHERESAFLHTGTASAALDDYRQPLSGRILESAGNALACSRV